MTTMATMAHNASTASTTNTTKPPSLRKYSYGRQGTLSVAQLYFSELKLLPHACAAAQKHPFRPRPVHRSGARPEPRPEDASLSCTWRPPPDPGPKKKQPKPNPKKIAGRPPEDGRPPGDLRGTGGGGGGEMLRRPWKLSGAGGWGR